MPTWCGVPSSLCNGLGLSCNDFFYHRIEKVLALVELTTALQALFILYV
jgi:hypothetical protein